MKVCESCGATFPTRMLIEGKRRYLNNRRFCLACSPFGSRNTSSFPLVDRTTRRRASWTNYSRRRRASIKAELVRSRGGKCEDCGYDRSTWSLDFHHLDAQNKLFALGGFLGSLARARREADKCALVCANCHRMRHFATTSSGRHPVTVFRQSMKRRALVAMGDACVGCGLREPVGALEFHHLDPATKEFGISTEGIPRQWDKIEAELAKCVLLCANCHREVHAGVRRIGEGEGLYEVAIEPLHKWCA